MQNCHFSKQIQRNIQNHDFHLRKLIIGKLRCSEFSVSTLFQPFRTRMLPVTCWAVYNCLVSVDFTNVSLQMVLTFNLHGAYVADNSLPLVG